MREETSARVATIVSQLQNKLAGLDPALQLFLPGPEGTYTNTEITVEDVTTVSGSALTQTRDKPTRKIRVQKFIAKIKHNQKGPSRKSKGRNR